MTKARKVKGHRCVYKCLGCGKTRNCPDGGCYPNGSQKKECFRCGKVKP